MHRRRAMIDVLWPYYVIIYGAMAGAGVAVCVLVAVTVVTLRDATRVSG